jgi:tRNA modification GTPase
VSALNRENTYIQRGEIIAAVATPPGIGALGIIRVSGQDSIDKLNRLFPKKDLNKVKSHTLHFGPLIYNGELLDEVLLSIFKAPHSYTGENSVEISCHGSPFILQKVMESLLQNDIRLANPGEFTLRAFLNGKLDLSQAEAVADLIASENEAARKAAIDQMRGGFSGKIKELRAQLLQFASLIELELDFAEEDVEFANREKLEQLLHEIYNEVARLADSFRLGNAVKSGVKIVIAGRPNAGKSTLLNTLLNEERAIVSEIPGTTRDTIEDVLTIEGVQFRFIDTAGIRSTSDVLENIGIDRTFEKLREAHIILYLFDVNELDRPMLEEELSGLPEDKTIILLGNKIDKDKEAHYKERFAGLPNCIFISGKEGEHIDELKKSLIDSLDLPSQRLNDPLVTNVRHYDVLQRILQSIFSADEGLQAGLTGDFLAIDIRRALQDMGEITGEITNDEILGNIFSKFCIGK